MVISEEQLKSWSHQGSITQSSTTYNAVKSSLEQGMSFCRISNCDIFLQGSYGNHTNIYAESDVDVVIQQNNYFYNDLESLSEDERAAYNAAHRQVSSLTDFKNEIMKILTQKYGKLISVGDKAITISAHSNHKKVDVIPACQFRRYYRFKSTIDQSYEEGISFFKKDGVQIINYPKQHSENLTKKHQSTNGWFKPVVRIIKNLHAKLIDNKMIEKSVASLYFIEGLLYNVPDNYFKNSYQDCFLNAINWIQKADRTKFVCVNGHYYLLQDGSPVTCQEANCNIFINAAIEFWNGC